MCIHCQNFVLIELSVAELGGGFNPPPPPPPIPSVGTKHLGPARVNRAAIYTDVKICEQNLIFHILTKFHGDDVIRTKLVAILSTDAYRFPPVFPIEISTHKRNRCYS